MSEEEPDCVAPQTQAGAEARPTGAIIALTTLCAFFPTILLGLATIEAVQSGTKSVLHLFLSGGVLAAIILCTVAWKVRSFVRADAAGLTWRGLFGRPRTVSWDRVTDYGYFSSSQTSDVTACERLPRRIVTRQGNVRFDRDWPGEEEVREAVCRYATAARTEGWKEFGTRPQDLPQRFAYSHALAWGHIILWSLVIPAVTGRVIVWAAKAALFLLPWGGWGWAIAQFLFPVSVVGGVATVLLVKTHHRWRAVRSGMVITASESGLCFRQEGCERFVRWEEIRDYYVRYAGWAGIRFVLTLRGANEAEFEFTSLLRGHERLAQIISHFCPGPAVPEEKRIRWRYQAADDVIGGALARWNQEAMGTRVRTYSYRTHSNLSSLKALAAFLVGVPGVLFIAFLLNFSLDSHGPPFGSGMVLALGIGVFLYFYLQFRLCSIDIDDFGMTYRCLWGTRRLLWISIVDYKRDKGNFFVRYVVESRDGRRLGFSGAIADQEELKQEIAARAPAPRTGWEELHTEAIDAEPQRTVPK